MWEPEGYVVRVAACIHDKYIFLKSAGRAKSVILGMICMYSVVLWLVWGV